ncbi:hypothetical protein J1N10_11780 [Carboxylicivirga sp. A043]|uniref:S28 family serine protease n=1 Tax=Carboxylicivirga litoralis TaxID=2816963 RepID=UPI0021CAEE41|nr:S28 family serine protease [Carboxylicivirga sp. A043]MCU4156658.1 hypothetical protein [Carboxylicivirga sp. A043]
MKRTTFYLILASVILFACEKDDISPSITTILEQQKEFTITETKELENGEQLIKFTIKQPLDHNNPNGHYLIQNGSLLHRNYKLPIIFMPSGYGRSQIRHYDLTRFTFSNNKTSGQPNILAVDHRYYGNYSEDFAKQDPKYLNIEQAAKDLHQVVKIFKKSYKSKWISMGYSKGGMTCIYHKYFFPEDVDATLSFVAPLTLKEEDDRFYEFIKNINTSEEYDKMLQFQRLLLLKRDELSPLLEEWYQSHNLVMDREPDKVIEGIALGYPFTYWQYRSYWRKDESSILDAPTIEDNAEIVFKFLSETYFLDTYSTLHDLKYDPYLYQSRTQLGYPLYAEYEQLSDLLKYYKNQSENTYDFNSKPVQNVINWLDQEGNNIIHFYGSKDPWTAAMYNNTPYCDALTLTAQGKDHLIDLLSLSTDSYAISKLEKWTGYTIENNYSVTVLKNNTRTWLLEELSIPIIPK